MLVWNWSLVQNICPFNQWGHIWKAVWYFFTDFKEDATHIIPYYVKLYLFLLILPAEFSLKCHLWKLSFENSLSANNALRMCFLVIPVMKCCNVQQAKITDEEFQPLQGVLEYRILLEMTIKTCLSYLPGALKFSQDTIKSS